MVATLSVGTSRVPLCKLLQRSLGRVPSCTPIYTAFAHAWRLRSPSDGAPVEDALLSHDGPMPEVVLIHPFGSGIIWVVVHEDPEELNKHEARRRANGALDDFVTNDIARHILELHANSHQRPIYWAPHC